MKNNKLKVVVLYNSGHLGSTILLNKINRMKDYEITGLVRASPINTSSKGFKRFKSHWNKLGWKLSLLLAWQSIIQSLCMLCALILPSRLRPAWRIAAKKGIACFNCENINEPDAQDFINNLKPDLLISAYFPQILKKDIIALPSIGTLNVHPGWLPSFQGAMAYFWALKQGVPRAGVSLHWIDEGIDTGQLISRKSFAIRDNMTQEQVLVKTAFIGAKLLQRAGRDLRQQNSTTQICLQESSHYFPLPSAQDAEIYLAKHRFFRIRDLFFIIIRRVSRKSAHQRTSFQAQNKAIKKEFLL